MANDLSEFVNLNCCNQMGCKSDIQTIVESLEALIEEAYEEGYKYTIFPEDVVISSSEVEVAYKDSIVKRQLEELKQEVCK